MAMRELLVSQVSLRNEAKQTSEGRNRRGEKDDDDDDDQPYSFLLLKHTCAGFHILVVTEYVALHVHGPILSEHFPDFGTDVARLR